MNRRKTPANRRIAPDHVSAARREATLPLRLRTILVSATKWSGVDRGCRRWAGAAGGRRGCGAGRGLPPGLGSARSGPRARGRVDGGGHATLGHFNSRTVAPLISATLPQAVDTARKSIPSIIPAPFLAPPEPLKRCRGGGHESEIAGLDPIGLGELPERFSAEGERPTAKGRCVSHRPLPRRASFEVAGRPIKMRSRPPPAGRDAHRG
jgi:hypothetical protein